MSENLAKMGLEKLKIYCWKSQWVNFCDR